MTGYELKTDGHKIAWSIKDYLDSLERSSTTPCTGGAGKKIGTHHEGDGYRPCQEKRKN